MLSQPGWPAVKIARLLTITIIVWSAIYISHAPDLIGINIAPTREQAIFLGLILALTFLVFPARKGIPVVKWYDIILIIISLIPTGYVIINYDQFQLHAGMGITTFELVLLGLLTLALLEGLRRAIGWILTVILLLFILHPLLSNHLPGFLYGRGYTLSRVGGQFFFPPTGVFGLPLNIAATIIVSFLIFGSLMIASGGGKIIMNTTLSMVGRVSGGAAKAAVIASGLFGTLSGSPSANCAATGTITIPMMKATGYKSDFAGGVEAAASNGGQLMPPVMGAVAFIMAELLGLPYFQIALMAFIPAILYYVCMLAQVHFEAKSNGLRGLMSEQIPRFRDTLKAGWYFIIPVSILLYLLFGLKLSPEGAAFWSALSFIPVTAFSKNTRLNFMKTINILADNARPIAMTGLACAMAGIMMGSVSLTGIALTLSSNMVQVAGGNLFLLLLLTGFIAFFLGMGMGSIPVYIFVVLMVAPAAIQMGVKEVVAHLFVFWLAMGSFITPPVAMAAFVASAIARCDPMRCAVYATRVGIGIFIIPFALVYNNGLALIGSPMDIILATVCTLIGVLAIASGLEAYLLTHQKVWERVLVFAAGLAMFVPVWSVRIPALIILVLFVLWQFKAAQKQAD